MKNDKKQHWGVSMGRISCELQHQWILDGLIAQGDQWIISGAPKSGKSLCAAQLALVVASGGQFLSWKGNRPARVLYMDFELKEQLFWRRLFTMMASNNLADQNIEDHFYRCGDYRSVDVLDPIDAQRLTKDVSIIQPDLIVWDVLARMHNAVENDNGAMGRVMRAIRAISSSAAHIVVHHARKETPGMGGYNSGAAGIRGASSIHGEADGVMALAVRGGQGARFSLQFSARAIETPDEMLLNRTEHLTFVRATEGQNDRLSIALRSALKDRQSISATELVSTIGESLSVEERQAKNYIRKCVDRGWIERKKRPDKTYEYLVLDGFHTPIMTDVKTQSARMQ